MSRPTSIEQAARKFIRGASYWQRLSTVGIHVEFRDGAAQVVNPTGLIVKASLEEVAEGLLKHQRSFQNLSEWSRIMLSGTHLIDLEGEFETDSRGGLLLQAVRDAAFGERPDTRVWNAATELVTSGRTQNQDEEL